MGNHVDGAIGCGRRLLPLAFPGRAIDGHLSLLQDRPRDVLRRSIRPLGAIVLSREMSPCPSSQADGRVIIVRCEPSCIMSQQGTDHGSCYPTLVTGPPEISPLPRRARLTLPNVPMHIIQRGNTRQVRFLADEDHRGYLDWLKEHAGKTACRIHPCRLMRNPVHRLVSAPAGHGAGDARGKCGWALSQRPDDPAAEDCRLHARFLGASLDARAITRRRG